MQLGLLRLLRLHPPHLLGAVAIGPAQLAAGHRRIGDAKPAGAGAAGAQHRRAMHQECQQTVSREVCGWVHAAERGPPQCTTLLLTRLAG